MAEYNQLKVLGAMQECRVNEGCFHYASGYGYSDRGRDVLEEVYAKTFHTEAGMTLWIEDIYILEQFRA